MKKTFLFCFDITSFFIVLIFVCWFFFLGSKVAYHNDAFHSANNARTRCASIVGGSALTRDFASIISRASQRLSIDVVVIEAADVCVCCDAKGAREEIKINKEKQNHQTQKNNSQKIIMR